MDQPPARRFACDAMLGGLARWLRAAGYDASWHPGIDDRELVRLAEQEGRTLLSCDTKIFLFRVIRDGVVPSLLVPLHAKPADQAAHVRAHFHLGVLEPRCMACGGALLRATKEEVKERVPPRTFNWLEEYWRCERCDRVFWRGTHWRRIEERLRAFS
ncbi:MAG: Mut7-C RNAse domain-containing protein [Gemmataceae bacterium]